MTFEQGTTLHQALQTEIDGETVAEVVGVDEGKFDVRVNGVEVTDSYVLSDGDRVTFAPSKVANK
jgi:hypothetical protein